MIVPGKPLRFILPFFLALLSLRTSAHAAGTSTVEEYAGTRYLLRTIVVPQGEFVPGRLVALSKAFLKEASGLMFGRLRIITDPSDADWRLRITHLTYLTAQIYAEDLLNRGVRAYAEVIAMGPDAVLRVRYGAGGYVTTVLQGSNPLQLQLGDGQHASIEWITHWMFGDLLFPLEPGWIQNASVFITTPHPASLVVAEKIYTTLKTRIPHLDFDVYFAPQAWFPLVDAAPIVNPIAWLQAIPSYEEYERLPRMYWRVDSRTLRCTGK